LCCCRYWTPPALLSISAGHQETARTCEPQVTPQWRSG
jgi:hypothetical protein